jgi:hypothetical protein
MLLKELIKKLKQYNQDADTFVMFNSVPFNFDISFSSKEDINKKDASYVYFYVYTPRSTDEIK